MVATSEFLTSIPAVQVGARRWPFELKAQIVAETLIEGATVKAVAKRYELIPSTVSDWRRMARMGKLVLPVAWRDMGHVREGNLDDMDFVPVQIEETKPPVAAPTPIAHSGTLDVIKGCVTVRLDAGATLNALPRLRRLYDPSVAWRDHLHRHQSGRFAQGSRRSGCAGAKPSAQEAL